MPTSDNIHTSVNVDCHAVNGDVKEISSISSGSAESLSIGNHLSSEVNSALPCRTSDASEPNHLSQPPPTDRISSPSALISEFKSKHCALATDVSSCSISLLGDDFSTVTKCVVTESKAHSKSGLSSLQLASNADIDLEKNLSAGSSARVGHTLPAKRSALDLEVVLNPPAKPVGFCAAGKEEMKTSNSSVEKNENCVPEFGSHEQSDNSIDFAAATGKDTKGTTHRLKTLQNLPSYSDSSCEIQTVAANVSHFNSGFTELVGGFRTASGKKLEVSDASIEAAMGLFTESSSSIETVKDHIGFSTASGKNIKVSDHRLQEVKQLFCNSESSVGTPEGPVKETNIGCSSSYGKGIANESFQAPNYIQNMNSTKTVCGLITVSGKEMKVGDSSVESTKNLFSEPTSSQQALTIPNEFSPIAGKHIKASRHSLKAVEESSSDFNSSFEAQQAVVKQLNSGFSTNNGKSVNIIKTGSKAIKDPVLGIKGPCRSSANSVAGFSTASGKEIKVSDSSIEATKDLFVETSLSDENVKGPVSCNTIAGKDIQVSKLNSQVTQNMRNNCDPSLPALQTVVKHANNGFSTANGKVIEVSSSSLKATKELFLDMKPLSSLSSNVGFSTASGKEINISSSSIEATKNLFAEPNSDQTVSNPAGFSTAAGKSINISSKSLQAVQKLFHHSDTDQEYQVGVEGDRGGFSAGNGKMTNIGLKATKDLLLGKNSSSHSSAIPVGGCSTASGKEIKVSNSSLEATKKLFAECSSSDETAKNSGSCNPITGKDIQVSKSNSLAARNIRNNCNPSLPAPQTVVKHANSGFSTANGKVIEVSSSSLKATKELFLDMKPLSSLSSNVGFSTASGKEINISSSSIEATKNLFAEPNSDQTVSNPAGFSTAAGKSINISGKSLQAVQKLFNHSDTGQEYQQVGIKQDNDGFATAHGKKIKVASSSLQAVKNLFSDAPHSQYNQGSATRNPVAGFSTARGDVINCSTSSLLATKHIFKDVDRLDSRGSPEPMEISESNSVFKDLSNEFNAIQPSESHTTSRSKVLDSVSSLNTSASGDSDSILHCRKVR